MFFILLKLLFQKYPLVHHRIFRKGQATVEHTFISTQSSTLHIFRVLRTGKVNMTCDTVYSKIYFTQFMRVSSTYSGSVCSLSNDRRNYFPSHHLQTLCCIGSYFHSRIFHMQNFSMGQAISMLEKSNLEVTNLFVNLNLFSLHCPLFRQILLPYVHITTISTPSLARCMQYKNCFIRLIVDNSYFNASGPKKRAF